MPGLPVLCLASCALLIGSASASFQEDLLRPSDAELQCLQRTTGGCRSLQSQMLCLSSRDGSGDVTYKTTKKDGEPCIWCGGGRCTSEDASLCAPYDFLASGEGVAYNHRLMAATSMRVASCRRNADAQFSHLQCLSAHQEGCPSIQDEATCLSSVDGRPFSHVAGFRVAGQPCVWCGGGNCHSGNSNRCEPYDYVRNGNGHAFGSFHAVGIYKVAACEGGQAAAHDLNSGFAAHGTSLLVECGPGPPMAWLKVSRTCGTCKVVVPEIAEFYSTCAEYCDHQIGAPKKCTGASTVHPSSCDEDRELSCDHVFGPGDDALCQCAASGQVDQVIATAVPTLPLLVQKPATTSSDASCSAHPMCAELTLTGNCCPSATGATLNCCGELVGDPSTDKKDAEETKVALAAAAKAAASAKDSQLSPKMQVQEAAKAAMQAVNTGMQHDELRTGEPTGKSGNEEQAEVVGEATGKAASLAGVAPQVAADEAAAAARHHEAAAAAAVAAEAAGASAGLTGSQILAAGEQAAQKVKELAGLSEAKAEGAAEKVAKDASQFLRDSSTGPALSAPPPVSADKPPPPPAGLLLNIGLDCWKPCNKASGLCTYCGQGNACCRRNGDPNPPEECKNVTTFLTWHHECITPMHQVFTRATTAFEAELKIGAKAAKAAKMEGDSSFEQAKDAAKVTGSLVASEGMTALQAQQAAQKAAKQATRAAGAPAAQAALTGSSAVSAALGESGGVFRMSESKTREANLDLQAEAHGNADTSGGTEHAKESSSEEFRLVNSELTADDGFTAVQWALMLGAAAAIMVAGAAGYYLRRQSRKLASASRLFSVQRGDSVDSQASEVTDLELQTPPASPQHHLAAPLTQLAQQLMVGEAAFRAMDRDSNGVIDRQEWTQGQNILANPQQFM